MTTSIFVPVPDHGDLTGLADDDHVLYLTTTEGNAAYDVVGAATAAQAAAVQRANHTGTQVASTISDFNAQVRTNRLDQMAAPTASVAMGTQKLTGLAAASVAGDAVRFEQLVIPNGFVVQPPVTGWMTTPATAASTTIFAQADCRALPLYLPIAMSLDLLGFNLTTVGAANSVNRMGLYASDSSTGAPTGSPLAEGTVATTSGTGVKNISVSTGTLAAGLYYIACVSQGAPSLGPTLTYVSGSPVPTISATQPAGGGVWCYQATGITGALPAGSAFALVSGSAGAFMAARRSA